MSNGIELAAKLGDTARRNWPSKISGLIFDGHQLSERR